MIRKSQQQTQKIVMIEKISIYIDRYIFTSSSTHPHHSYPVITSIINFPSLSSHLSSAEPSDTGVIITIIRIPRPGV